MWAPQSSVELRCTLTKAILDSSASAPSVFELSTMIGYCDYSEDLAYLTLGKKSYVHARDEKDAARIMNLHHYVELGFVPVRFH